jgi:hypothetical protein
LVDLIQVYFQARSFRVEWISIRSHRISPAFEYTRVDPDFEAQESQEEEVDVFRPDDIRRDFKANFEEEHICSMCKSIWIKISAGD